MFKRLILWMFVIFLGIGFGAGIYEARIVIPQWISMPPHTWPNTGLQFWVYVTTIPLTLLTIFNAIAAWNDNTPKRVWWLGSVGIIFIERIATFFYFIPEMIRLMGDGVPEMEIIAGLSQWMMMNHGRHVLSLAGWLLALKAFSMSGKPHSQGI